MDVRQLTGYYTYRSFLNNPMPVDDFNQIKFAEAELFLNVQTDGTITGTLSFPAQSAQAEKLFMDITKGSIKILQDQFNIEFTAQGRKDTEIFEYLYDYYGSVTHTWENGINQRLSLAGTVLRVQDHGSGDHIAKAGATASFIAVQRDFVEPRDIHEIAILPSALEMVASKSHRLIHAVWHTLRGRIDLPDPNPNNPRKFVYVWYILDEESKNKIRELGWYLERPPFTKPNRPTERGSLNLVNGAGEDFLYMHRKMITMIRMEYESKGIPYIQSWKTPSLPLPDTPQFVYSEKDDPTNPGKKIFQFNALESGNMVPLPPFDPKDERNNIIDFTKSSEFFYNVMTPIARIFSNATVLGTLSLGALGNLIEFTIHNSMHNRWANDNGASLPDPNTGDLKQRGTFDFDPMWDDPKYDYLGEFYSSHVNPLFWRLHGWVNDRIEDWFNAHESMQPGEIQRRDYNGVSWFKPGKWVQVEKPFYWPEEMHHHFHDLHNKNNDNEQKIVENILKVMDIIKASRNAFAIPASELSEATMKITRAKSTSIPGGSMNFIHTTIDIEQ
jgi:hypothetical protein